jgi:uroporphyrinogen-III decarboxylase
MAQYKPNRSFFKTGENRFRTVLSGETPDRVPVAAQMHEFSMRQKELNPAEFYTKAAVFVPPVLECMEKYGIDIPFLDFDIYNIEVEGIGQKIKYSNENMPDVNPHDRLLKDKANLKKIKTPNFETEGRFANVVEMYRLFHELTGVKPVIRFTAPFSMATHLRGVDTLILDIYDDPEWVKELFTVLTERVLAPYLLYLKKHVANDYAEHGMGGADAMASPPLLSPEMLQEWVVPYFIRLRELVGPEVYLPNWWGDRYFNTPEDMFDLKHQVCPGFLEVQDPDVETFGPEICKAYATKHNLPLVLGLGSAFLATAKADEVYDRVKHYVQVGAENGGFYLYLCNLGATTPTENVVAAMEAVEKYGTYQSKD